MRQLVYALRFTGRATPAGPDGGVLAVVATAPGATLTSPIGLNGLAAALEPAMEDEATMASELTLTGATSVQAVGAIVFGGGHRLCCSTVGSGYLDLRSGPGLRHGAVTWRVDGGEGQFAGVTGLITANFLINADLAVIDHHCGVLFLA
jgi:hypothetical protein